MGLNYLKKRNLKLLFIFSLLAVTMIPHPVKGELLSYDETSRRNVNLGGTPFLEVNGSMEGLGNNDVPYAAPVTVLFPKKAKDSNGNAILNFECMSFYEGSWQATNGESMMDGTCDSREQMFPDNLLGKGYIYSNVMWNKYVCYHAKEMLGEGKPAPDFGDCHMGEGGDAHVIAEDAAQMLASTQTNGDPWIRGITTSSHVIASGASGGAAFLRTHALYQTTPQTNIDGYLNMVMGPFCWDLSKDTVADFTSFYPCLDPIEVKAEANGFKVINYNGETDPQVFFGAEVCPRDEDRLSVFIDSFRCYETAGGPHLTDMTLQEPWFDLFPNFHPMFNPAPGYKPVASMLKNLFAWIADDIPPPPSTHLGPVTITSIMGPFGGPIIDFTDRDEDGNTTLGLRLPHIQCPLGSYNGIDTSIPDEVSFHPVAGSAWGGGRFDPFTSQQINERYPTHHRWVQCIKDAAGFALDNRWIRPEDYVDYLICAQKSVIGKRGAYSFEEIEEAHCEEGFF